ncbi:MAG TPA: hypothetical protein VLZ83_09845 [Edaphocola sp.]|nr:hypothetical protein [Edaphocola sp.]
MNKVEEVRLKVAYWLSFFTLIVLSILSIISYKERTLFVDSSWFITNILHTKSFYFMEMRFGAFITQLGTIAAIHLGLSLKSILIIFSISFYIFYLFSFWAIGGLMKQKKLAILFVFYLTLFISDGYFCTVGEIFQGITWMLLFFALYFQKRWKHNFWSHLLMISFAFLGLICHMIIIFPFAFLWLFINLETTKLKVLIENKKFWIYSAILLVLAYTRYYVSNLGWYDAMKLEPVKQLSIASVINAFKSGHAKTFLELLMSNYWIVVAISLVSILFMIKQKKWIQTSLYLIFVLGYFALVCVVYPDSYDRNLLFYFENEYAPLSIILAAPFVWYIFKFQVNKKIISIIFISIFSIRLFFIFDAYQFFHHRFKNLQSINNTLYDQNIHKALIIAEEQAANAYFVMSWGLPVESMLLSKLENKNPVVTFKIVPPDFKVQNIADSFYSCFTILPQSFLNKDYILIDSKQEYKVIEGLNNYKLSNNQENYKSSNKN